MGNYEQLKQAVSDVIKTNGNQEITGAIMQNTLLSIISTVGSNATFAGIATPETNPGTPDQNVFWLACEYGTYSNFGGIVINQGVCILIIKNNSWKCLNTNISSIFDINTNNLINPFILINKYAMLEDGWYNATTGQIVDSNSSFQRVDYQIRENAKSLYCMNAQKGSGFAICLMNGDELLHAIQSAEEMVVVDMSLYPTCKNIRVCTQKTKSDKCFVLVNYAFGLFYDKNEIDNKLSEINEDILNLSNSINSIESKVKDIYFQINGIVYENKSAEFKSSAGNLYINIPIEIKANQQFNIRANADISKLQDGTKWACAVTDIYGGYYYVKAKMDFNVDNIVSNNKDITKCQLQIRAVDFKDVVDVEFIVSYTNENSIDAKINELSNRIDVLENEEEELTQKISINEEIYCVVCDIIQLYYDMFIDSISEYSLNIKCSKGNNFPRYWQYTPTINDVGETNMTIQLIRYDGSIIQEKTVKIITKNPVNPKNQINVLLVGDSLYMDGQIAIELSRRLKGTTGVATSPNALNLNNYNIVGRRKNADESVGWEGTGGWTWQTYTTKDGMPGVRLNVQNVTDVRIGDIYNIDGHTQNIQISEVNVIGQTGNIFGGFYGKWDIYNDPSLMPESGILTRISGTGQENITFNSSEVETFQPFWNNETDSFDIVSYVNTYCGGTLDYMFVQLGINSCIGSNPFSGDFNSIFEQCKIYLDLVHSQLPNLKIYIATLPLPSQNGGLGSNYSANGASGSYLTKAWNSKIHKVNELYMSLNNDVSYNTYVKVVDVCAQLDSQNNYPYKMEKVNTRSDVTEKLGTNGVHPSNFGYWQIADSWFRALICNNE